MPKKVSADTICEVTVNARFFATPQTARPSSEQMIAQIRADLQARIESLARNAAAAKAGETDPSAPPSPFEISHQRALKLQKDFEQIVAQTPKGFRLVPVLYSKIEQDQNTTVYDEFKREVRREFLKYVAAHHAGELLALGICPHGIERMKKGLDPADENEMLYEVNIDHIVERSGGGKMSLQQSLDPLLPAGSPKTFLVNHFDNLILLPEHVHEAKNLLNEAQQASQTRPGDGRWVLMMIPEAGPGFSGFVAAPQDKGHYLHGLRLREQSVAKRISHASYVAEQLRAAIDDFRKDTGTDSLLKTAEAAAGKRQKTVLELMAEEKRAAAAGKKRLADAFNEAVAKSPAQKELLESALKPALNEAGLRIKAAFNEASKPGQNDGNLRDFIHFFQGKKIGAMRNGIEKLPLEEAAQLSSVLQDIERKIKPYLDRRSGP